MKKDYRVIGMTCSACVAHVEKAVRKVNGIENCSVNLVTNILKVEGNYSEEELMHSVDKAGYGLEQLEEVSNSDSKKDKLKKVGTGEKMPSYTVRLWVSFGLLIPLMYVSMSHMFGLPLPSFLHGNENAITFALVQLLLCLPILYVNRIYFINGYKRLFHLAPNMDSLIAIGSTAGFVYGIFATFMIGYGLGHNDIAMVEKYSMDMYYESAGMILALITLGKYFEDRAKTRTKGALSKLIDLQPKSVTVLRNGEEVTISAEQVQKGDLVVIKTGDRLPVDGIIREGYGVIDQSAVTGESFPVNRSVGENVISGTVCVDSHFVYEAVSVGKETTISKIIELMENAQTTKAPIQKLADKVSGVFVPIVISIAIITFIVWLAVGREFSFALALGIAVLVISCPCALGLATPLAIMVGTGLGAERGVLFKSAESIESLGKVSTVVFDKTGTITTGNISVERLQVAENITKNEAISIICAVESSSKHPLANAIREYANANNIECKTFAEDSRSIAGKGVVGRVNGKEYICGNAVLMHEYGLDTGSFESGIGIKMYLADNEKVLALVTLADTVKESSKRAIAELKKRGIKTVMLTGDNKAVADKIGEEVGIDRVIADVLPDGKEQVIRELQSDGEVVAMCGDGINDSVALVRSDVGFAVAHGSDIAIDSADIVLMKSEPYDLVEAVDIARKTIRTIKFNLFWAFAYNTLGIPLAAGVLYPWLGWTLNPMIAAAAMSCSSLFVVGNTLLLKILNSNKKSKKASNTNGNIENENQNKTQKIEEKKEIKMQLKVKGMMCAHCKMHVEKALQELGLTDVVAIVEEEKVVYTDNGVDVETVKEAIRNAGYTVE